MLSKISQLYVSFWLFQVLSVHPDHLSSVPALDPDRLQLLVPTPEPVHSSDEALRAQHDAGLHPVVRQPVGGFRRHLFGRLCNQWLANYSSPA